MQPTIIGVVLVCVCLYFLRKPVKYMFGLMLFSSVFQAAPACHLGDGPVPLFFVAEFFFVWRVFRKGLLVQRKLNDKVMLFLLFFVLYAIGLTCVAPFMFAGIPVISGSINDYDLIDGILNGSLSFTFSNIIQMVYIIMFFLTAYCISLSYKKIEWNFVLNVVSGICLFVVLFGVIDLVVKGTVLGHLVDLIFHSWKGYVYSGAERLNSTFNEASYAGAFFAFAFWFCFYTGKKYIAACTLMALLLNLSGTGIVSFCIGGLLYVVLYPKYLFQIIIGSAFALVLVYMLGYEAKIYDMVFNKGDSISGLARSAAMRYSLELFKETFFIGVGVGSHRCMGFLTGLFASLGVIGTFLFLRFVIGLGRKLWTSTDKSLRAWAYAGIILFGSCTLSIPDLSFPIIWFWVFTALVGYFKLNDKYKPVKNDCC